MRERESRDPERLRTGASIELDRLLRAEAELERAIAECTSALQDIRRELRWQDPGHPPIVH